MKTVSVTTLGSPPSFNIPTSDPLYWLLRLCYEKSYDRYNYSVANIQYSELESADISAIGAALNGDFASFRTWWETFLVDKGTAFVGNVLDLAPLISALASGGSEQVLSMLVGVMVNAVLIHSAGAGKVSNDNTKEEAAADAGPLLDNFHLEINNDPSSGNVDEVWVVRTTEP